MNFKTFSVDYKSYNPINFAGVIVCDLKNREAMGVRIAYIERQLNAGLYQKISDYQKKNENHRLWSHIASRCQVVLSLVRNVYKKHPSRMSTIFELEQVLGRVDYLFCTREGFTHDSYQENLRQLNQLAAYLSGHKSSVMRYLGGLLVGIGVVAIISLLFLAPWSMIAAVVIGVSFVLGGIATLYGSSQKGLSLATSKLVDTTSGAYQTMNYFEKFISPKLNKEDRLPLKDELDSLIMRGFDPNALKKALKWAAHYSTGNFSTNYGVFFRRVADICCASRDNNYWIQYQRVDSEDIRNRPIDASTDSVRNNKGMARIFSFWSDRTSNTLMMNYFDKVIAVRLSDYDSLIFRKGLQRLIHFGYDATDLKGALEWVKSRYDNVNILWRTPDTDNTFLARIADICGVELEASVPELCRVASFC